MNVRKLMIPMAVVCICGGMLMVWSHPPAPVSADAVPASTAGRVSVDPVPPVAVATVAATQGLATERSAPPDSAAPPSPLPTAGSSGELPYWMTRCLRECGLKPEDVTHVLSSPQRLAEAKEVWGTISIGVAEALSDKAKLGRQIAKGREGLGLFQEFQPDDRLPDADERIGEYIEFGYAPNPRGGPDLVRIVRILPGESPEFDRLRLAELAVRETRRAAMLELLRR
jgi:hypothetical protein